MKPCKDTSKYFFVGTTLLFIVGLLGCNAGDKDAETSGFINNSGAWPGGKAEVCFVGSENAEHKRVVKSAVQTNFKKSITGIEFVGWNDCKPNDGIKIRLMVTSKVSQSLSKYLGTSLVDNIEKVKEVEDAGATLVIASCAAPNTVLCLHNGALHHFGHTAGLFHEHLRPENKDKTLCQHNETGADFTKEQLSFFKLEPLVVGQFDKQSVMNFCQLGTSLDKLKLSPGDVAALRKLYKLVGETPTAAEQSAALEAKCPFDSAHYLQKNPDLNGKVQPSDAAKHYSQFGKSEARLGGCSEGMAAGESKPAVEAKAVNSLSNYLGVVCNTKNNAAGKFSTIAADTIVCTEDGKSAVFKWAILDIKRPLGAQCNHNKDAANKKFGDLTCKPFVGSATGWRWLP